MKFNIITIFPELINNFIDHGLISKAVSRNLLQVETWNPRDFCANQTGRIDDKPFGGGPGMILKPDVLQSAYEYSVKSINKKVSNYHKIMLTPRGERLNQSIVRELSQGEGMIFQAQLGFS